MSLCNQPTQGFMLRSRVDATACCSALCATKPQPGAQSRQPPPVYFSLARSASSRRAFRAADALSAGGFPAGFPGVASAVPFVASAFAGGVPFPGYKVRCAYDRLRPVLREGLSRSRAWRDRLLPWLLVVPSQSLAARVPFLREAGVALSRFPALPVP